MMSRIILVICVTINTDYTLSDPLNAYKIWAHGHFAFLRCKSSFILPEILDFVSHGIFVFYPSVSPPTMTLSLLTFARHGCLARCCGAWWHAVLCSGACPIDQARWSVQQDCGDAVAGSSV